MNKYEVKMQTTYYKIGRGIASVCDEDRRKMTYCYLEALTYANYPGFRQKVAQLYNKEFNSKLRLK